MTNLLTVLPDFDLAPHAHIIPSLERARISTADLLTLDPFNVAKRAQVPSAEVQKLFDAFLTALRRDLAIDRAPNEGPPALEDSWSELPVISTLDDALDAALGGGVAPGHLTEMVGESAAGKTQCLLTLLLSAQLTSTTGEGPQASALYLSTEAPLQTSRLSQILQNHPRLAALPPGRRPSLNRIHSARAHDVEAQEHILHYQVPVAIAKHNVRLVVIDSIAANYRAEFDKDGRARKSADLLAKRSTQLGRIGTFLRNLAQKHNVAVVVANQVSDRFIVEQSLPTQGQVTHSGRPDTQSRSLEQKPSVATSATVAQPAPPPTFDPGFLSTDDPLALDHQQRFYTGWGNDPVATHNLKTPSLGLAWTNQLSARLALLKEPVYETTAYQPGMERNVVGWQRSCKVVFSAWCGESETPLEIWTGGVRSVENAAGKGGG